MFYSDSRQNNITFYTADWKSEMKMPAKSSVGPCSELKWPIIILLTLTFVAAAGKLKLLLSVAIISNYSLIIIRRWRPHINNKRNTHRCPIILSQVLLFYFADLGSSQYWDFRERSLRAVTALKDHTTALNDHRGALNDPQVLEFQCKTHPQN